MSGKSFSVGKVNPDGRGPPLALPLRSRRIASQNLSHIPYAPVDNKYNYDAVYTASLLPKYLSVIKELAISQHWGKPSLLRLETVAAAKLA